MTLQAIGALESPVGSVTSSSGFAWITTCDNGLWVFRDTEP